MKHLFNRLIFILLMAYSGATAQNIQIVMSPKPSPYLSDWETHTETLVMIVNNTSGKTIDVKISTQLFNGNNNIIAETDLSKMPVLSIPAGVSSYHAEDIYPVADLKYDGSYKQKVLTTGRIPDDNYRLCVSLTDPKTGLAITSQQPQCKMFTITAYQDPILLSPRDKDTVTIAQTKGFLFKWTPVVPTPKDQVTYRLQVWEILPGQDAMRAFLGNKPIVEKDFKSITQAVWPPDFELPREGMGYVWSIQALDAEGRPLDDNAGRAEPFSFGVKSPMTAWTTVYVNGLQGNQTIDSCHFSFSFNHPGGGQGEINHFVVLDATVNSLTCPVLPSACSITPVMDFITTNGSLNVDLDNNTGSAVIDFGNGAPVTGLTHLICGHHYIVTNCIEGSAGLAWGGAYGSCASFLFNCCLTTPKCSCKGWDPVIVNINGVKNTVPCGGTIHVPLNTSYTISTDLICSGKNCVKKEDGKIILPDGTFTSYNFGSGPAVIGPLSNTVPQNLQICFYGSCNNYTSCAPCCINIIIDSPATKPCTVTITGGPHTGDTLCKGAPVTITWTGTSLGNVNISLVDVTHWVVYQTIATNVPNTGSYTWTLPTNIACDSVRKWQFYIEDITRTCWTYGPIFYIKCCDKCCPGKWGDMYYGAQPGALTIALKCSGQYKIPCNKPVYLTAYYICNTSSACVGKVTYNVSPAGATIVGNVFTATSNGTYTITMYGWCGNTICDSCKFQFIVTDCKNCCPGKWGDMYYGAQPGALTTALKCGGQYKIPCKQPVYLTAYYICNSDPTCIGKVTYTVSPTGATIVGNVFTATSNGTYTITMYGWCGNTICDSCKFQFIVTDCKNCCPGKWGDMYYGAQPGALTIALKCGGQYKIPCNKPVYLTAYYICNASSACVGKVTYNVSPAGATIVGNVFTATSNGTYTITMYGWCGNTICDSCKFQFIVTDCKNCCPGKWGDMYYGAQPGALTTALKCGGQYKIPCNKPVYLTAYYICNTSSACVGKVTYNVSPTGATIVGNVFTATSNGTYTITMYGWCGNTICDSCKFQFIVTDCKNCCPGKWGDMYYGAQPGALTTALKCGGQYKIPCNKPVYLTAYYICNTSSACVGKVTYNVSPAGATIVGNVFTATSNGTYTITMYGWCGNTICDSCKFEFIVTDCKNCCPGKWGDMYYGAQPGALTTALKCNGQYKIHCKQPVYLTAYYICNSDPTCIGKVTYTVSPTGATIVGNVFTATANGTYTITMYGWCGNTICDSCKFQFIVTDCKNCCPGKWGDMYYGAQPGALTTALKCSGQYKIPCKQPVYLTAYYICNSACVGKVTYNVSPAGATIVGNVFTATSNGTYTITMYGWCGNTICDSCKFQFIVTDCKNCCPGKWGDMYYGAQPGALTTALKCSGQYKIPCNKPVYLTAYYICNASSACVGKVTYTVSPAGATIVGNVFTATSNGTYTITMYGWCGNSICDSCKFQFIVTDCKNCCPGKWGDMYYGAQPGALTTALKCGGQYKIPCNKPVYLTAYYICNTGSACVGKVTYNVSPSGATIVGNVFTAISNGTYTITMYGWCGNSICDSCKFEFIVTDCKNCCPGKWGDMYYGAQPGALTTALKCGGQYKIPCNQPVYLTAYYTCNASSACVGKVTYNVSPSGATIVGNVFTAISNGTYTITMYGWCGNSICDSCKFEFIVTDCKNCCPGKWGDMYYGAQPGALTTALKCGGQYKIPCNQPVYLTAYYTCNASSACIGKVTYNVSPTGATIVGNVFTATSNGTYTITMYGWCGNTICDSCKFEFIVTDCKNCCPGKWGDMYYGAQPGALTIALKCGGQYKIPCNKPVYLTAYYICNTSSACVGKVTYNVSPAGATIVGNVFTATSNGTYTITMYGWCGNTICDSCKFEFIVTDCKNCCPGKWGDMYYGAQPGALTTALKCGGQYKIPCNQPVYLTAYYTCNASSACIGKVTYTVSPAGATIVGNVFTATSNGTYTITMYGWCGNTICDSCKFEFIVTDCKNCCPGKWGDMYYGPQPGALTTALKCGGQYKIPCNKPVYLTAYYICNTGSACVGKVTYNVSPAGATIVGNVFTATSNGTYTITMYGWCGNTICDSCKFEFIVTDCKNCCPGKWGDMYYGAQPGALTTALKCGGQYKIPCNQPVYLTAYYTCNASSACIGKVTYTVSPAGATIVGNVFTATSNGTYTITMYGWCGNTICDSCKFEFIVTDCKNCCPGKWGDMYYGPQPGALTTALKCGGQYKIPCNKPVYLTAYYICNTGSACVGKVTYNVSPAGATIVGNVFTATSNGTYTITMYGWCGNTICDSCKFQFIVTDCKNCCPGKWGHKFFGIKPGASTKILSCDKGYKVKCNTNYYITASYLCNNDPACKGSVAYKVSPTGATITATGVFNATVSGSYIITIYGICGTDTCDKCSFQFLVGPCKDCHCYNGPTGSGWSGNPVTFGSGGIKYDIPCKSTSTFNFVTGTSYTFNSPAYTCSPNNSSCQPVYMWKVDGISMGSGSSFTYTFSTTGSHTVTIIPVCGSDSCPPCEFYVNVKK